MAEEQPPLILCMENATGEDVALRIEPNDDFQSFLVKAKLLLGFDVDINSITRNQPVSLSENIYQFLINAEQTLGNGNNFANSSEDLQQLLDTNEGIPNDLVYILDDSSQVKASHIQFGNEECVERDDLTADNIPFVKYTTEDDNITNDFIEELTNPQSPSQMKKFNILESPISRCSSVKSSPSSKFSFVNSLPFKPVPNVGSEFASQFAKFVDNKSFKTYSVLNTPIIGKKSPNILQETFKTYSISRSSEDELDSTPCSERPIDDFTTLTREEILNMLKDSPVKTAPYKDNDCIHNDKPRHIRKTDPSRPFVKKTDTARMSRDAIGINVIKLSSDTENQSNCFVCDTFVNEEIDKIYILDNEDQKLYRDSPQKTLLSTLKVICDVCLNRKFHLCLQLLSDKTLNPDEFLVIRCKEQYIYKKRPPTPKAETIVSGTIQCVNEFETGNFVKLNDAKAIIDKIESEILKQSARSDKLGRVEFVKVEIGSDGEIVTKSVDDELKSDDVTLVNVKEEIYLDKDKARSSDIELLDAPHEYEDVEILEDDDEDVRAFLGKYQCSNEKFDMKCRFCTVQFTSLADVIPHSSVHRLEDEGVYPCPLCEYGYEEFAWLRGHIRTAHRLKSTEAKRDSDSVKSEDDGDILITDDLKESSEAFVEKINDEIKNEIKDEYVDSDSEAIWILQTDDADSELTQEQINVMLSQAEGKIKKKANARNTSKTHKCTTCKKHFISVETLEAHKCSKTALTKLGTEPKKRGRKPKVRTQEGDNLVFMPTKEDFLRRMRKRRHVETTSDPQVVTCHNCGLSFTSKVRLKFHMQFHERNSMSLPDGRYKCAECGDPELLFSTETELFDHVHFQHDKRRRWICPVQTCGKTFFLRATLTKHSRTHTDTRRYACETCGKRFLDKQTLDEHSVTHLKIKPFQCHICLKHLTRRSRLRMHLRAHEEELVPHLVFVCSVCDRAFKDHVEAQEHGLTSKECLEARVDELKKESDDGAAVTHLSPTSGLVSERLLDDESDMSPEEKAQQRRKTLQQLFEPEDGESVLEKMALVSEEARPLVRVVEIEKAFRCEFCEDVFYLEDALNAHRAIHRNVKNPFTCHICKVSFPTYSRCTTHKTTHGFYKRSLAEVQRQGVEVSRADGGVKREAAGPSATGIVGYGGFPVVKHFLCEDCGRSYLHWTYLQVHRRMKHANDWHMYKCNQCDATFPNSWGVAYHRRKVHGAKTNPESEKAPKVVKQGYRIPCRDCDEVLPNKSALYKHRRKEHSDISLRMNLKQAGLFSCAQCGKRYASKPGLETHLRSHAPSGSAQHAPYACAKCGKAFALSANLTQHVKEVHSRELEHACNVCGKTFCSRAELSVHSRTHSSQRPHVCPVCGHAFRTVSMRNEHLRIHTGERPYPCDVCGVAFRRSTAMRNHRLIHTGVRAFPCPRCPKRFRIRSDLRTHLRLKHPEQILVIEVNGLNPDPEKVLEQLTLNNISPTKVLDIAKISFPKGSSNPIPMSESDLSTLVGLQRDDEASIRWSESVLNALGSQRRDDSLDYQLDGFQPARRGRGIAKNPRRPKILQRLELDGRQQEEVVQLRIPEPGLDCSSGIRDVTAEELSDLDVRLLLKSGVLVNGSQLMQLQLNSDPLMMQ